MPTSSFDPLHAAIKHALDGSGLLFVGAGVSFLLTNAAKRPLPNGIALNKAFHNACGIDYPNYTLDRISGHYLRKFGSIKLYDFLCEELIVQTVDPELQELYRLDWQRIYTTNYDNAIEISRKGISNPAPLILNDAPRNIVGGATIHLNGSIKRVSATRISDDIILTDVSYASDRLVHSPWAHAFRSDLRTAKSIIFVGYSLADLDIAKILIEDRSLKSKTVFVIAPNAPEIDRDALEHYGMVYATGVKVLFEKIREIRGSHRRADKIETFSSLKELTPDAEHSSANAVRVLYDQLIFGLMPLSQILTATPVFGDTKYLVKRVAVDQAFDRLRLGSMRDTIITGELACGKTFGAIQLGVRLREEGYRVFIATALRDLERELQQICRIEGKICIIFDQYRTYLDNIKTYADQRPLTHCMILTERLTIHELLGDVAIASVGEGTCQVTVLDHLTPPEAAHFDALMNFLGLWGEYAGLSSAQRLRRIDINLGNSLYRLLLEAIKSKKVQDDIRELIEPLKGDETALQFFTTAFISNIIGVDFWINDWQDYYDIRNVREVIRKFSAHLRHFMLIDAASIRMRTGLISAYLLQQFLDNDLVLKCLVNMFAHSVKVAEVDKDFRRLSIELAKYSTIEPLFRDPQKLAFLVNYYEEIREFGSTKDSADYWLQYGIASTIYGDLGRAETAFKNAYSRERSHAYPNLTRIDNYFSRFEMQKAVQTGDKEEAFRLFKAGSDRLVKQIFLDNNRHYPFKTGRAFSDIAAKHYASWSPQQQSAFVSMARSIREKAQAWKKSNRVGSADVEILIRETGQLLTQISTKHSHS
nr:SIR2 family protein [uncultured Rhodopila sp.]